MQEIAFEITENENGIKGIKPYPILFHFHFL